MSYTQREKGGSVGKITHVKLARHHLVCILAGSLLGPILHYWSLSYTTAGRATSLPSWRAERGRDAASPMECGDVLKLCSVGSCWLYKEMGSPLIFLRLLVNRWESPSEVRVSSPKLGYKIMSACFEVSGATSSAGCERADASGPEAWQTQEEASSDASGIRLVNRLVSTNLQRHKASSDYV